MDRPKKKSSWDGITPEQRAVRIQRANATRKASKEIKTERCKKWEQEYRQKVAKEKYEAFRNAPHWATYLDRARIDQVIAMLNEVFDMYQEIAGNMRSEHERRKNRYEGLEQFTNPEVRKALKSYCDATRRLGDVYHLQESLIKYKRSSAGEKDPVVDLCKISRDN